MGTDRDSGWPSISACKIRKEGCSYVTTLYQVIMSREYKKIIIDLFEGYKRNILSLPPKREVSFRTASHKDTDDRISSCDLLWHALGASPQAGRDQILPLGIRLKMRGMWPLPSTGAV